MTLHKGYDSIIGYNIQTGTSVIQTSAASFLFAESISFVREQNVQSSNEIGGGGRDDKRIEFGDVSAYGSITRIPDSNNGLSLYQHLLCGSVTSVWDGSAYQIIFMEGDEVLDAGSNTIRLNFELSVGGESTTTRVWGNGVVESYTLSISQGSPPKETWNFKFSDHTDVIDSVSSVSLIMAKPFSGNGGYVSLSPTVTTLTITAVQDFTLNINNNILEDRALCNTTTVRTFHYGKREVTGSFSMVFHDYTAYNSFVANTYTAITVLMKEGGDTGQYMAIQMPKCYYTGGHPSIDQASGLIVQPINFVAHYPSLTSYDSVTFVAANAIGSFTTFV